MTRRKMHEAKDRDRVRLQKYLSDTGVASRRAAEELILAGRVLVNNEVVDKLPVFVDPRQDRVVVDGTRVRPQGLEYFLLHKPRGVICTDRDEAGRMRAIDLMPDVGVRLFVVGRLDIDSTGLLLLTNDGDLAERVTHPRYGLPKVYHVEVRGELPVDTPQRLRKGVFLSDGKARASEAELIHRSRQRSVVELTLREGRNRVVRRLFARLGYPVKKLKRIAIGPLSIKRLPLGAARRLGARELDVLRRALENVPDGAARAKPQRRSRPAPAARESSRPSEPAAGAAKPAPRRKPAPRQQATKPGRRRRVIDQ